MGRSYVGSFTPSSSHCDDAGESDEAGRRNLHDAYWRVASGDPLVRPPGNAIEHIDALEVAHGNIVEKRRCIAVTDHDDDARSTIRCAARRAEPGSCAQRNDSGRADQVSPTVAAHLERVPVNHLRRVSRARGLQGMGVDTSRAGSGRGWAGRRRASLRVENFDEYAAHVLARVRRANSAWPSSMLDQVLAELGSGERTHHSWPRPPAVGRDGHEASSSSMRSARWSAPSPPMKVSISPLSLMKANAGWA